MALTTGIPRRALRADPTGTEERTELARENLVYEQGLNPLDWREQPVNLSNKLRRGRSAIVRDKTLKPSLPVARVERPGRVPDKTGLWAWAVAANQVPKSKKGELKP
jgi:hypothetical protein